MKLYFQERLFSWFDSYDVYDEAGETVFTVQGKLAWGKLLQIFDRFDQHIGTLKQVLLTWLPRFEIETYGRVIGEITKEFSFFKPRFTLDCNGWSVEGDWLEWDYAIYAADGREVARVSKELFRMTDHYTLDIADPADALTVLLVVLAIDAEKETRN